LVEDSPYWNNRQHCAGKGDAGKPRGNGKEEIQRQKISRTKAAKRNGVGGGGGLVAAITWGGLPTPRGTKQLEEGGKKKKPKKLLQQPRGAQDVK